MKICFIPIDNRPVCYNLAKDIAAIDENIELFIPPREFLGDLTRSAGVNEIIEWIENIPECDAMVISLDTIAYGGLIPSRRSPDSIDKIKIRLNRLKPLLEGKKVLQSAKRNFEINKTYLNWGLNTLIFSKDDCAPKGFNVDEARELERLGAKTKTGADEIPLTLLARAIEKEIKVFVEFTEPDYKDCISNYEDVSIEKSVQGQLELGGFTQVQTREEADVILIVNNFIEKQGEHVMGWTTQPFRKTFTPPDKPYAIADVRYANGADNDFVEQLLPQIDLKNFYGYAGWNTSANTIGSLLAGVKVRWNAGKYNEAAFKRLQIIRFLDDWAYQANVRGMIENPCDIQDLMKPYEIKLAEIFGQIPPIEYLYPWSRKFEVEISI